MSTSDRTLLIESLSGAALLTAALVVLSPGDLWIEDPVPHPAWIVVFVIAARYGLRGLFSSLAAVAVCLGAMNLVLGGSWDSLALRAARLTDLMALVVAVLVAWIAKLHEGTKRGLRERLSEVDLERKLADDTIDAMRDALASLRERQDRMDVSLTLWRDLAGRMERGDAAEAARATLELCAIRSGASGGIVHGWDGARLHPLAWHGQWAAGLREPRDLGVDRTALAAIHAGRPVPASAVEGATSDDSDVAVPVFDDGGGSVLGVICLRGVSPSRLASADLSDLSVAARWLASALLRPIRAAAQVVLPMNRQPIRPRP